MSAQHSSRPESDSPTLEEIRSRLASYSQSLLASRPSRSAVLIPVLPKKSGAELLFELRAYSLRNQPGEVCFPGGAVEAGESSQEAAVRETMEELLVSREQLRVIADLGAVTGPLGRSVRIFAAILSDYGGSAAPAEVERSFSIPLSWFLSHPPAIYHGELSARPEDGFPFDRLPGGAKYPFARRRYEIPLYLETDPLIWGMTARIVHKLCKILGAEQS